MRSEHLDELRRAAPPDEAGAKARAWGRLEAEIAARPERRALPRRPRLGLGAGAALALLLGAALAVTPPGDAVADWVRTAVGLRPQIRLPTDRAPRSVRPPSGGQLLVSSSGSTFIVGPDGTRRRLGPWTAASWSPHGRFAVAWQSRRLAALDPRGHVQWSLTAPRLVTDALWSPSGFRIAYRAGGDLRVVAGDGTGDRSLDPGTFTPMAWRPGHANVLAYESGAHVDVVDVDARRRLTRIRLPFVTNQIAWSADGSHLYVNLHRSVAVYDAGGRRIARLRMPHRSTVTTFVPARRGDVVAVSRRRFVVSEVVLMAPGRRERMLFRGDGRFSRLRFSPDGSWLVAAWPLADQWVYLRPGGAGARRVLVTDGMSRRFDARGFPQLRGWCCPP